MSIYLAITTPSFRLVENLSLGPSPTSYFSIVPRDILTIVGDYLYKGGLVYGFVPPCPLLPGEAAGSCAGKEDFKVTLDKNIANLIFFKNLLISLENQFARFEKLKVHPRMPHPSTTEKEIETLFITSMHCIYLADSFKETLQISNREFFSITISTLVTSLALLEVCKVKLKSNPDSKSTLEIINTALKNQSTRFERLYGLKK